jgi:pheromone shutdown protein TraB
LKDTDHILRLVEVGNVSRQVRGEHMVRTLVELVNKGERVFAVVGASHVIRQEPVLRQLLKSDSNRNRAQIQN